MLLHSLAIPESEVAAKFRGSLPNRGWISPLLNLIRAGPEEALAVITQSEQFVICR